MREAREEFTDFERIPHGVSDRAAQGVLPQVCCVYRFHHHPMALLSIVFDSVCRAHMRNVWVLSCIATCAALTQQIPKPVELHLNVF